jgi:carbamoyl-phosphate synthase small subunit
LLEDGFRLDGDGFGASGRRFGEVVFTTGMVGYPESLTDPSYRGQILTFTYPLLGNYGVPDPAAVDRWGLPAHVENPAVQVRGMVARGRTAPNHWQSDRSLESWLESERVPGLSGVDTRRLTQHLRTEGVLRGVIEVSEPGRSPATEELLDALERAPRYSDEPLVAEASPKAPMSYLQDGAPLIAVLDCGIKSSIVRALLDRHLSVVRLPYDARVPDSYEGREIRGLLIGNGPGDPATLKRTIEEVRAADDRGLPTLGICLGHQLLALSHGARTFKLKYGHRGQNKTVEFAGGRALIVSENHGYAVDPDSLRGTGLLPWAKNPDDGTLEGLKDRQGRVLALQGHPEGHPGPQEAGFVFDEFAQAVLHRSG